MSVNGVTNITTDSGSYQTQTKKGTQNTQKKESSQASASPAAVYEPSSEAVSGQDKIASNRDIIAKMQMDAEQKTQQLQSLVEKMFLKQGKVFNQANDIWSTLAGGNFTVDAATRSQAQADIADDGYWGVDQTSTRILDFAKALSGSDPEKADELLEAFKKGYEQAEKTWGGSLPEISKRTYDAVLSKFEQWKQETPV